MGPPMPSLVSARRRWGSLLLKLAAVAAAGWAQAVVESRPVLSAAGFGFGAVLFVIAERVGGSTIAPERQPALTPTPRTFWWLFGTGCAFCFATAPLVELQAPPETTHPLWVVGMTLLMVAAVHAWWSEPQQPRPSPKILGTLLLLFIVAGILYGWHLSTIPPEVHGDEAEVGNDAIELLAQRPFNLFMVGWYWLPMFHALPAAAGIKMFGVNMLGLRCSSGARGGRWVSRRFSSSSPS